MHLCTGIRHPLILVQVNIDNDRIKIFYVFTHLITDSIVVFLNFLFIPATNLDDTNLVMVDIC
jgi:hypothetical protein